MGQARTAEPERDRGPVLRAAEDGMSVPRVQQKGVCCPIVTDAFWLRFYCRVPMLAAHAQAL